MPAIVAFLGTTIAFVALAEALFAGQAAPGPAATPTPAPEPATDPTPTPDSKPPRLRLDIDRHVDSVLKRAEESGLPRFEDRIEVSDRAQQALEALLRGAELACSPSSSGPPPTSELNRYKTVPIPPYADFVAAAKAILKGLKRINPWRGPPRFVLYALRQADTTRFVLREGELPLSTRLAVPGTEWEELARFHERGEASEALRRLERGFETLSRRTPGEPPHPSMSIKCLPPASR